MKTLIDYFEIVRNTLLEEGAEPLLATKEIELVRYGHETETGPRDCAYQIISNREEIES